MKVFTSGHPGHLSEVANLPDVNMIISKAMSEAFAAGSTMPMAKDGKAHIVERNNSGEEIIVKRSESPATDGRKELREEVKVSVARAIGGTGKTGVHAVWRM